MLSVSTFGLRLSGLRVPMYWRSGDWYRYWRWLNTALDGDIVIGDFNADPSRHGKRDDVLGALEKSGPWIRPKIDGDWSYCGTNGKTSRVDHVLTHPALATGAARYVARPFVPRFTDHAALVVEVERD